MTKTEHYRAETPRRLDAFFWASRRLIDHYTTERRRFGVDVEKIAKTPRRFEAMRRGVPALWRRRWSRLL
jgi:hypothetical protein